MLPEEWLEAKVESAEDPAERRARQARVDRGLVVVLLADDRDALEAAIRKAVKSVHGEIVHVKLTRRDERFLRLRPKSVMQFW